jgi:hypothetical protein
MSFPEFLLMLVTTPTGIFGLLWLVFCASLGPLSDWSMRNPEQAAGYSDLREEK